MPVDQHCKNAIDSLTNRIISKLSEIKSSIDNLPPSMPALPNLVSVGTIEGTIASIDVITGLDIARLRNMLKYCRS